MPGLGKGIVISPKSFGKRERRSSRTLRKLSCISFSLRASPSTNTRKPRSLLVGLSKSTQFTNQPSEASTSWNVLAFPRLPFLKVASAASVNSSFQVPFSAQSPGAAPPKPRQPRVGASVGLISARRCIAATVSLRSTSSSSPSVTCCAAKLSASSSDGPGSCSLALFPAAPWLSIISHIASCFLRNAPHASIKAALATALGGVAGGSGGVAVGAAATVASSTAAA
mmetsp:Transcript_108753/g.318170  ORF Transcript_108753/g.318170 Transcript_108753/m.318170 type:complete len:226 (-) Transcript_108753:136-813(-)